MQSNTIEERWVSDETISPKSIIETYIHNYRLVYGRPPTAHYMREGWFRINGETVHYSVLLEQIEQLHELARLQQMRKGSKNAIRRLIDKLRFM